MGRGPQGDGLDASRVRGITTRGASKTGIRGGKISRAKDAGVGQCVVDSVI